MARVLQKLLWIVLAAVIVAMAFYALTSPDARACEPPYTLAIGSSVEQTSRLLDSRRITYSTTPAAEELKSGLLTSSGVEVPENASVAITHVETKVVNRILGKEQTCVTIIWFDGKQALLGVSRFIRRTWL